MHPALSVILFTVASGAGYGMLAIYGSLAALGWIATAPGPGLGVIGASLALVTLGLLSSTFHLGHPERAWRALSQWRSSWLSREGVSSLATYLPALLLALGLYLGKPGWIVPLGVLSAAMAVLTICCTAMIYASLKPIHQWRNGLVLPGYLALAFATGALWLSAILRGWSQDASSSSVLALIGLVVAGTLKLRYWRFVDETQGQATAGSATGLGRLGAVRLFEGPHSGDNYLLKEMGFQIARKHAAKLRRVALVAGFVLPFLLLLPTLALVGAAAGVLAALAAALGTFGVLIERWLFFAEARHTVMLYYGAERA